MQITLPDKEKEILEFWKKDKVFEKSLKKNKGKKRFVFFEGPPFANGLPGIHHLLARAFKDVILRYKTMKGFYIERKAGWDTHGLPTEMAAEKSLGIKSKKEIEKDISKFTKECSNNVFTYKKEWEEFTERIGFWLDLKDPYVTCSDEYIESLWWALKQAWDKKLLYDDYKVVPYCPRCGTSLSSHELAQGYKTVRENSIYVKMAVKGERDAYFLVWTTTPWTLPGNVAVAVNSASTYVKAKVGKEILILAKDRLDILESPEIIEEIKGKDLLGLEYEPLFAFIEPDKKAYFVVAGNFVSTEEGTGIVHIAPAFGDDDMRSGKENDLPVILNIDEEGKFKDEVKPWKGMFAKDADPLIVEELKKKNVLFKEVSYEHEYPFCWRCDSPLLYYAKESWFIKSTQLKEELIKNNKKINWFPEHLKEGRFGEWLNDVKDWNLSRERYWGTPLPIWKCDKCDMKSCFGSIKDLEKVSGKKVKDLHRPEIDEIVYKCKCGGEMKRVPEVIDCWFDSGSMPFAQWHYPFENKERIDKGESFPADFICEGIDQTRGWFYTLLVVSTVLGKGAPYKNVVSVGIVLDEKGQKMSKSKGNVVKPADIIDEYGADVARFYFYTVNPVAEAKKFDFKDVQTLYRKFFDTLLNTQKFFITYADSFKPKKGFVPKHLLDRWIVSRLESLNAEVAEKMDQYDIVGAARLFESFVDDLSNWYIRRSRKRFRDDKDSHQALYYVLAKTAKLLAPFTPFLSEIMYKEMNIKESVHLEDYPEPDKKLIDKKIEENMQEARDNIQILLAQRTEAGIKVKQPLKLWSTSSKVAASEEYSELVKEEGNVKEISVGKDNKLDTEITEDLKEEGMVRELIRNIQQLRKEMKLSPKDEISVFYSAGEFNKVLERERESILKDGNIKELKEGKGEKEVKVGDQTILLTIKKK